MTGSDAFGGWGPVLAILAMACATYLCRVAGVVLMSRVTITPRIERAMRALPGSIVAATVTPIALRSGPAALVGIAVGIVLMRLTRNQLAALVVALLAAAGARALGIP